MKHTFRQRLRLTQGPEGVTATYWGGCSCGWQHTEERATLPLARADWEAHRAEAKGTHA